VDLVSRHILEGEDCPDTTGNKVRCNVRAVVGLLKLVDDEFKVDVIGLSLGDVVGKFYAEVVEFVTGITYSSGETNHFGADVFFFHCTIPCLPFT